MVPFTEIFDIRLKLFFVSAAMYVSNVFAIDVFDMAGKAGTMPMQVLMIACILVLGAVIVWQNKSREQVNKDRHEESQRVQNELITQLKTQQASIDAERIARIGKLMEQQAESIDAQNSMAHAQERLADALTHNNRAVENLERTVTRFADHLSNNGK